MNHEKRASIALQEGCFYPGSNIESLLKDIAGLDNQTALVYLHKTDDKIDGVAIYDRVKQGRHLQYFINNKTNYKQIEKNMFEYFEDVMDDVINAKIALENNLYIKDFQLKRLFEDVLSGYNNTAVIELKYNDKGNAIGAIAYDHDSSQVNIGIFIKEEYRGKGYGYELIEQIKPFLGKNVAYGVGENSSTDFWERATKKYSDIINFHQSINLKNIFKF